MAKRKNKKSRSDKEQQLKADLAHAELTIDTCKKYFAQAEKQFAIQNAKLEFFKNRAAAWKALVKRLPIPPVA